MSGPSSTGMSALRSKTDILQRGFDVRYVPIGDVRGIGRNRHLTRIVQEGKMILKGLGETDFHANSSPFRIVTVR
jgi:hypothetical protein